MKRTSSARRLSMVATSPREAAASQVSTRLRIACSSFCIVRLDDTGLEGGVAERKYKGGLNERPPSAHQRAFLHVRAMYESKEWSEIALNGAIRILEGVRRD